MSTTFNPFSFAARQGQDESWGDPSDPRVPGSGGGGPNTGDAPGTGPNKCQCATYAYEVGHPCYEKCKSGTAPPPQPSTTSTCPGGQCKDTLTGVCRGYNPNNEKPSESDGANRGNCKKLDSHGGGGGGAGAGGPKKATTSGFIDPGGLQSDEIWQAILARLKGESRYTPAVVSSLMGEQKTLAEGQAANQEQQLNANLTQRGMLRAPNQTEGYRSIRANVGTTLLQSNNQIKRAKIDADFEDKTAAINEGIAWLNSLRDYYARMAATSASKDVGMANVQLGYAQLQQQLQIIREQYAQQLQLLLLGST